MPETAELFNLAASHFKIAETHLKDTENTLYTLQERLEDIREPINKLLQAASPSLASLDKFIHDHHPIESINEEIALHNLDDKLEENLTSLVKIWRDKSVDDSYPIYHE